MRNRRNRQDYKLKVEIPANLHKYTELAVRQECQTLKEKYHE